jgi:hypothetical protein
MSLLIVFILGYAIGGASALLLAGLALASRKDAHERPTMELVGRDAEHYSL